MLGIARRFSSYSRVEADFSHVVIGGGVIGLAVANELQQITTNSVAVLEQHSLPGMETTSRNSEVIHAGIYYPPSSLKARFCVRGKELIYRRLDPKIVPFKKCGKWIVAQTEAEGEFLENLHQNASDLSVPTFFVPPATVHKTHPLIRAEFGALESPTTGIISSHDLTLYFQAQFENAEGTMATNTKVYHLEHRCKHQDYIVTCLDMASREKFRITAENVINCGGLHAPRIANMLLPKTRQFGSYFAKGNYFSYAPHEPIPTTRITDRLIYPCPHPNASGLGTHMTFDLGGQIRFGPDLEWMDESITDASNLDYDVSSQNLEAALKAISSYYPNIKLEDLQPSYTGFRPKLHSRSESSKQFSDFYIREEKDFPGFVNMIGIESPGLTSAVAIAEYIKELYHS